uniref:DDE Tnp4 domain-containing protein n=1 Tax=Ixodes ricinus TaxID=34613 RepID=A0A6B0V2F4_IXORI
MKIKHGLPFSFLASLFCIPSTTAFSIFKLVLVNLKSATKQWVYWPSRAAIHRTMPASFRVDYPMCRVILDCTVLETEMPPGIEERNLWYSQFEGRCTLKYLIGIAPNGMITFISEGFRNRATDAALTAEATFLSLLEPGDVVLADKGFPEISTDVGEQRATLVMPPFATSPQFTESEVDATYETASVRIHVERVIQRLKMFSIL